jgi:hypothetical protein
MSKLENVDLQAFAPVRPFHETVSIDQLALILGLLAQSIALYIVTAAMFTITFLPADSFYYVTHLPVTYWWGLGATIVLLLSSRRAEGRNRTALELASLLLLGLYVLGLPSFVYDTPRILDSYQHAGNALGLLNNQGWIGSPIWYARQFPGGFTFFAQLILIPGLDPFLLMRFFVIGCSSVIVVFLYTIIRSHSSEFAAPATSLFLGALWFQLHLSPQALELILYLGLILLFVKMIENPLRSRSWTILALFTAPIFIVSHPETVILMIPGVILFLLYTLLKSRPVFRELLSSVGLVVTALTVSFAAWWLTYASDAFLLISSVARGALVSLSSIATRSVRTAIPSTPSYSYRVTITSELVISGAIWAVGVTLILLSRLKLLRREAFLGGLFTIAVLTVPVTVFVRTDMLARSYLFSLIPLVILFPWLLERRSVFKIGSKSLHRPFKMVMILGMIALLVLIPISRNGNDPEEIVPQSSLFISSIAGGLQHSVLLINLGEYGYWYYSTLKGGLNSPRDEQENMTRLTGGFIEANSTLANFHLTLTNQDASSNYILLSQYYENLYALRFGNGASKYIGERNGFESQLWQNFNLVYSSGTDRLYENQNLS